MHEVPGGGLGLEAHPGGRKERQSAPGLVVLAASHSQMTGGSHRATDLRLRRVSSQLGVTLIKSQKMWGSQDVKLQPFPLALAGCVLFIEGELCLSPRARSRP